MSHNVTTQCLAHTDLMYISHTDEASAMHYWSNFLVDILSSLTSTELYCKHISAPRKCTILSTSINFSAMKNDKCVIACLIGKIDQGCQIGRMRIQWEGIMSHLKGTVCPSRKCTHNYNIKKCVLWQFKNVIYWSQCINVSIKRPTFH